MITQIHRRVCIATTFTQQISILVLMLDSENIHTPKVQDTNGTLGGTSPTGSGLAAPDLLHGISWLGEPLHEEGQGDGPVSLLGEVDAVPAHTARRVRARARSRRAAHQIHVEVVRPSCPAACLEK